MRSKKGPGRPRKSHGGPRGSKTLAAQARPSREQNVWDADQNPDQQPSRPEEEREEFI